MQKNNFLGTFFFNGNFFQGRIIVENNFQNENTHCSCQNSYSCARTTHFVVRVSALKKEPEALSLSLFRKLSCAHLDSEHEPEKNKEIKAQIPVNYQGTKRGLHFQKPVNEQIC